MGQLEYACDRCGHRTHDAFDQGNTLTVVAIHTQPVRDFDETLWLCSACTSLFTQFMQDGSNQ